MQSRVYSRFQPDAAFTSHTSAPTGRFFTYRFPKHFILPIIPAFVYENGYMLLEGDALAVVQNLRTSFQRIRQVGISREAAGRRQMFGQREPKAKGALANPCLPKASSRSLPLVNRIAWCLASLECSRLVMERFGCNMISGDEFCEEDGVVNIAARSSGSAVSPSLPVKSNQMSPSQTFEDEQATRTSPSQSSTPAVKLGARSRRSSWSCE